MFPQRHLHSQLLCFHALSPFSFLSMRFPYTSFFFLNFFLSFRFILLYIHYYLSEVPCILIGLPLFSHSFSAFDLYVLSTFPFLPQPLPYILFSFLKLTIFLLHSSRHPLLPFFLSFSVYSLAFLCSPFLSQPLPHTSYSPLKPSLGTGVARAPSLSHPRELQIPLLLFTFPAWPRAPRRDTDRH